jgi:hypothetical protein
MNSGWRGCISSAAETGESSPPDDAASEWCQHGDVSQNPVWGLLWQMSKSPAYRRSAMRHVLAAALACDWLFHVAAQVLEDLLLPLLDFKQDRHSHARVVLSRMDLTRLQQDSPQIGHALLRQQHSIVSLDPVAPVLRYRAYESSWKSDRCPAKDRAFRIQ